MRYLELTKLDGKLRVAVVPEHKAEVVEIVTDHSFNGAMDLLWDWHFSNSNWSTVRPEEVGALTGNEWLFTDTAEFNDNGELVSIEGVYAFDNYQLRLETEELVEKGFVDLTYYPMEAN